jgi:hypothetical protein
MTDTAMRAEVEGPVTGGSRGYAFGRTLVDLGERGYVEEEFVLTGEARRYRPAPGSTFDADGRWDAEPAGSEPFRTRLLIYRPADAARFNGTVIVHWNNVTAGYDLFAGDSDEILDGYAFVGATTQRVGVHGLPHLAQGLAAWDPQRYGSLSIPTDDCSYDIFTQAARAVDPHRAGAVDPLGGLAVRRVIAMGASQSAGRLATYINAVHPLTEAFDAYICNIYFGAATPLEVGDTVVNIHQTPSEPSLREALRAQNRLRDDLDARIMVVNSELEAIACYPVRQPDTDRFRYWEAAGTCHVSAQHQQVRARKYERDFGAPFPVPPGINRVPMNPLYDAAVHHVHRWLADGTPPPVQPRIEFAGDPLEIIRDDHGLAVGGIRLPQVEVPLAHNSAIPSGDDIFSILQGSCRPFPPDKIRSLYADEADFGRQFETAASAAVDAGVLLPRDVGPLVEEARATYRALAQA